MEVLEAQVEQTLQVRQRPVKAHKIPKLANGELKIKEADFQSLVEDAIIQDELVFKTGVDLDEFEDALKYYMK